LSPVWGKKKLLRLYLKNKLGVGAHSYIITAIQEVLSREIEVQSQSPDKKYKTLPEK
jgi:hypothetical protein